MVYSKRFGAFIPLVSFLASLLINLLLIAVYKTNHLGIVFQVLIYVTLFVIVYIAAYLINLILIFGFAGEELDERIRRRWNDRCLAALGQTSLKKQTVSDYIEQAADIHMWLTRPRVIETTVVDLVRTERSMRATLEKENEVLRSNLDFSGITKSLANHWRSTDCIAVKEGRLTDDPVQGCIVLDEKLSTILAHPLLQRLNRVRQLSFSYTQFPSSTHTRLSHCLGVARNAEVALSGLFDRGEYYVIGEDAPREFPSEILRSRKDIIQKAKLVALLHDLGHGPFGHALDNYVGFVDPRYSTQKPDKIYTARYVRDILAPTLRVLGHDPDEVANILNQEERWTLTGLNPLIGDVVDSSLDVDRMDYLVRDAHMTGLSMGFSNTQALLQRLRPLLDHSRGEAYILAYDETALGYMEHFIYAREAMYYNCYEHPRKKAAERIFQRLIQNLVEDRSLGVELDDLYALTDDEVLCVARALGTSSEHRRRLAEELMGDLDYIVIHEVSGRSEGSSAGKWVEGSVKGRSKRDNLKLRYIMEPATWEEAIATKSIGKDRAWQIQVIVPPLRAYLQQHSAARILLREQGALGGKFISKQFFDVSTAMKDILEYMNLHRNKIKVMCPAEFSFADRQKVRLAAIEELGS